MADPHVWVDFEQVGTKTMLVTYLTQTMERGHTRGNDLTALSLVSPRFGRSRSLDLGFSLGSLLTRSTSARITVVRRRNMAQPDSQPPCDRRDCIPTSGSHALAHPELKRSR